jgi:uncharacterized phiE125 gp8 family phage protein
MAVDANVALISLSDARAWLKITAVDATVDAALESLINQISVAITNYVGRKFLQASYTEYYDGDGRDRVILNNFPVSALTSLHDDPDRQFGASTLIDTTNIILDSAAGIVRVYRGKPSFLYGVANIKAVYTAGYTLANIPHDIQLAARLTVADYYQSRYVNKRYRQTAETIADRTIQYQDAAFPPEAKQILEHHKVLVAMSRGFS